MYELVPFATAIAPARSRYRSLVDAAERWAAERAAVVDADLFALVCAGSSRFGDDTDHDPTRGWTRVGVFGLLRCDMPNWCTINGCVRPPGEVPAVWHWLDFLHDSGRLDATSDPLWELRKPLICYGGLDFDGSRRPDGDPSPIACECGLGYRESVRYLNREFERAEQAGYRPAWETPNPAPGEVETATLERQWTSDPPPPTRRARSRPATTRRRRPATKRR